MTILEQRIKEYEATGKEAIFEGCGYYDDFVEWLANRNEWVSVEDRLPKEGQVVDVIVKDSQQFDYQLHRDRWCDIKFINNQWESYHVDALKIEGVTHWKPLPQAPQEDK
jgi:hypothetical protein